MNELNIMIYCALIFISASMFLWRIQEAKQPLNWLTPALILSMGLFTLLPGLFLTEFLLKKSLSPSLWNILSNLLYMVLGGVATIGMYQLNWAKRDSSYCAKDHFITELLFIAIIASLMPLILNGLVRWNGKVSVAETNILFENIGLWDGFLSGIFIFLIWKTLDFASQIPFHLLKPWQLPNGEFDFKVWQDKTNEDSFRVHFAIQLSADYEHQILKKEALRSFQDAPQSALLGDVFHASLQGVTTTIGDLKGNRDFWLRFRVKQTRTWQLPSTWIQPIRYAEPRLTILENDIRRDDLIYVERIPI